MEQPSADQLKSLRYVRRLNLQAIVGLLIIFGMLPVVAIESSRALQNMQNAPPLWLPETTQLRKDWDVYSRVFNSEDIALISWSTCVIGSKEVDDAVEAIQPWTKPTEHRGAYLNRVISGSEVVRQLTERPLSLSHGAAVGRVVGTLIGHDGKTTCIVISVNAEGEVERANFIPELRQAIAQATGKPADAIQMVGPAIDGYYADRETVIALQDYTPPSAIIATVLTWFCLRSVMLSAPIILTAIFGQGLTLAMVHWLGVPMNAVLMVAPPLVLVLTVSAGIHLSNYYIQNRKRFSEDEIARVVSTSTHSGYTPCILATVTTVIGLATLIMIRIWPVEYFGIIGSLGVLATLVMLLLIMPGVMVWDMQLSHTRWAFLCYRGHRSKQTQDASLDSASTSEPDAAQPTGSVALQPSGMSSFLKRPMTVVVVCVSLACFAAIGLQHLRTSVNIPRMFLPGSPLRQQLAWMETHVGPTIGFELLLSVPEYQSSKFRTRNSDGNPQGVPQSNAKGDAQDNASDAQANPNDAEGNPSDAQGDTSDDDEPDRREQYVLDQYRLLRKLHGTLLENYSKGGVFSGINFLPSVGSGHSLTAITQRAMIVKEVTQPGSRLQDTGYVALADGKHYWRITLFLPSNENIQYQEENARIRELITPLLQESDLETEMIYTGSLPITAESQTILLHDLFLSFVAAFAIVGVVMALVLRSLWGGLLSMVPNLFPTFILFGSMGWLNRPVDIGTVMTASVALGIAVDGTLHMLNHFRHCAQSQTDRLTATILTLRQCGPALWQTTIVCGLSLMTYALSGFVPTQRFAIMMFALLSAALFGDAVILTAMMASPLGRGFLLRWFSKQET